MSEILTRKDIETAEWQKLHPYEMGMWDICAVAKNYGTILIRHNMIKIIIDTWRFSGDERPIEEIEELIEARFREFRNEEWFKERYNMEVRL